MTVLEILKQVMDDATKTQPLSLADMLRFHEACYRYQKLNMLAFLVNNTPITTDVATLTEYHNHVKKTLESLLNYEYVGLESDDQKIKVAQREKIKTAKQSLLQVINKTLSGFVKIEISVEDLYAQKLKNALKSVMIVFMAYRDTIQKIEGDK